MAKRTNGGTQSLLEVPPAKQGRLIIIIQRFDISGWNRDPTLAELVNSPILRPYMTLGETAQAYESISADTTIEEVLSDWAKWMDYVGFGREPKIPYF